MLGVVASDSDSGTAVRDVFMEAIFLWAVDCDAFWPSGGSIFLAFRACFVASWCFGGAVLAEMPVELALFSSTLTFGVLGASGASVVPCNGAKIV